MKHFTKITALVLCVIMACGMFVACQSAPAASSSKHFEMQVNNLSEYAGENASPIRLGKGSGIFGFDGWILTGTKTKVDENSGEATDAHWTIGLDIEETSVASVLDYTLSVNYYAAPSSAYTQPVNAMYTFTGKAYAVDGGYHLFTPTYGEATVTGQAMAETPGWGADTGEAMTAVAPDGSTLYFYYANSDLQLSGYNFGFPLNGNLLVSIYESDVKTDGSAITGFANVTETVSKLEVPSSGEMGGMPEGGMPGGPEGGPEGGPQG